MTKFDRAKFTESVTDRIPDNKAISDAIFDLLDFTYEQAFDIVGGQNNVSFGYVVTKKNGEAPLFYCNSSGTVEMTLGNFDLNTRDLSPIVRRLRKLSPAFEFLLRFEVKREPGRRHSFLIKETLVDPTIMANFKVAILELEEKIESAETGPQKGSKRSVPYLEYVAQKRQRKREHKSPYKEKSEKMMLEYMAQLEQRKRERKPLL